ncbi:MAG: epoxyalkane--coenzyme M transferase [Dehalococcoidia bacterium]|nr:epoxyalkane--coenzyme M transferase [Dehalococcoidia bacterium]
MKRSTDRIIMSHAGSLHRPDDLKTLMAARKDGEPFDAALAARIKSAVAEVVKLQEDNGVDVVNDGEYTKRSWQSYARGRLGGIEYRALKSGELPSDSITAREQKYFPGYFKTPEAPGAGAALGQQGVFCTGPITYVGQAEVQRDLEYFKAALQGRNVAEGYLSALAPGTIEHWLRNDYYKTEEEFLFAVADAMHEEYKTITDAGIAIQLDDPDLPDGWQCHPELTEDEYLKYAAVRVEALNHSIRDIKPEMVRLHICWGSSHHPHTQDLPISKLFPLIFAVNADCVSFEAANPMHEWEWVAFEDYKLPAGKFIMPGVLGHNSREFVEHPELVAQRLIRYANLVGRENVIGGTDCGLQRVAHAEIQWAKFRAGAEGARIATKKLWGR